jgi:hypothetical protein
LDGVGEGVIDGVLVKVGDGDGVLDGVAEGDGDGVLDLSLIHI